jgi:SagB-type dehydrogenase family enzyme
VNPDPSAVMKHRRALVLAAMGGGIALAALHANEAPRPMPTDRAIILPGPRFDGKTSVEKALKNRRSVRDFADKPLKLEEVSQLLWAAQGITDPEGLRAAPSAGALYPLESYLVAGNVDGLPAGAYRYRPKGHALVRVVEGDKRKELCDAALAQPSVCAAPAVLVFTAVYERTTAKYRKRGVRYVHMEAGHAAENVCLQAVSLGLGTVTVGAFDDDAVKKVLGIAGKEQPLYLMPVGRK